MDRVQKLAVGSIAIGLAVLGLKFAAYYLTGSIALYSDALESIVADDIWPLPTYQEMLFIK